MGTVEMVPPRLFVGADVDHDPEVGSLGGAGGTLDLAVINTQSTAERDGGGKIVVAIPRARHE